MTPLELINKQLEKSTQNRGKILNVDKLLSNGSGSLWTNKDENYEMFSSGINFNIKSKYKNKILLANNILLSGPVSIDNIHENLMKTILSKLSKKDLQTVSTVSKKFKTYSKPIINLYEKITIDSDSDIYKSSKLSRNIHVNSFYIDIKSLVKFNDLESLSFSFQDPEMLDDDLLKPMEDIVSILYKFPKLKSLSFKNDIFEEDLKVIYVEDDSKTLDLTFLEFIIGSNLLSDGQLEQFTLNISPYIAKIKNVKVLMGNTMDFNDESVKYLSKLTTVESLSLGGNDKITESGFLNLSTLSKLKSLDLSYNNLTDTIIEKLIPKLTNLKFLDLSTTEVTSSIFKTLRKLNKLEILIISETEVKLDRNFRYILKIPNLKKLVAYETGLRDDWSETIQQLMESSITVEY
jgi:hypothetical protein